MDSNTNKGTIMNIGIIGVGKLGLVYALAFEKHGCTVYASSYKQEHVESLQKRQTDTFEPMVAEYLRDSKNITFTTDNHEVIKNCDIIYVMVATPSTDHGDYDVSALQQVVDDFKNYKDDVKDKILIVGCTVNPGDCERMQSQIKHLGVAVVYCPTFAAQGSVVHDVQNPRSIMFGTDDQTVADRCKQVFDLICSKDTYTVRMQTKTAEILKMAMNCYWTMRISFCNQIGQILIQSGMQDDMTSANHYVSLIDSKKGPRRFGFGFGGPCFPRDNRAFGVYANKLGNSYEFGQVIDRFNQNHSVFLAQWLMQDNKQALPFYFDYITYKPGVLIMEESQQFKVCCYLLDAGCKVFIKISKFLPEDVKKDLLSRYPGLVNFVSEQDLDQISTKVYHIDL
jgi:UDPglucose 6-dehydrogenase